MKKYLLALLGVAVAAGAQADRLAPEQALARLNNSGQSRRIVSAVQPRLDKTVGELYVFTTGEGFMILPATDVAPALLAYSDNGKFSEDNPGVTYWMEFYNRQLSQASKDYQGGDMTWRSPRAPIAPLIKTKWNQEAPYNELCPLYDGHAVVTGCVATAMAQQMKYYNYPLHGIGTHSYEWRKGEELSFDYENTDFQWDLMTDTYSDASTEEERHAVAELMLACGISVDMHYSPGASGAATIVMGCSLIDIFGYSPSIWMPHRDYYGYDEWESMVYADLAKGMPVLYSGSGTGGGHQFICDGYDGSGYFHFNWGWGGMSDGYFLLTALDPDSLGVGGGAGGFNSGQTIALGVRPPEAGDKRNYILYDGEEFRADRESVSAGEYISFDGRYLNYSMSSLPEGARLQVKIVNKEGGEPLYLGNNNYSGLGILYYRTDLRFEFPELHDGVYEISPVLDIDGEKTDVRVPLGYSGVVTATVVDGKATFADQTQASVTVSDVTFPDKVFYDGGFPMEFTVTNGTTLEFYNRITPYILNEDEEVVAASVYRPMDVLAGESVHVTDYRAEFRKVDGKEFGAGAYRLVFRDVDGKDISEMIPITFEELPEKNTVSASDFRIEGGNVVTNPAEVKFSFMFSCTEGYFYGNPRVTIFPYPGGYSIVSKDGDSLYLLDGQEKVTDVVMNLDDLDDGRYMAVLYTGDLQLKGPEVFEIKRSQTAVETVGADEEENLIYDLTGRRLQSILEPGVYVVNGRKIVVR